MKKGKKGGCIFPCGHAEIGQFHEHADDMHGKDGIHGSHHAANAHHDLNMPTEDAEPGADSGDGERPMALGKNNE